MTRIWARMILLVCLALALWPASAPAAVGTLSPNRPPWMETSTTTESLPRTGSDLPRIALAGVLLLATGAVLRVRVTGRGH